MSSFGTKLKEVRKAKGMTQKDLASAIGAAHNSVSNWEHDQNEPALDVLKKICVVLGVSPEELLGQEKRDQVYHGVGYAEGELIKKYSSLTPGHQQAVLALIDSLIAYEKSASK